jgi:hypothetical protein
MGEKFGLSFPVFHYERTSAGMLTKEAISGPFSGLWGGRSNSEASKSWQLRVIPLLIKYLSGSDHGMRTLFNSNPLAPILVPELFL